MLRLTLIVVALCFVTACDRSSKLDGKWSALWETSPEIYSGDKKNISYTMEGLFEFDANHATVIGYGYEGCIFSSDTIKNTLTVKMKKDSLFLINEEESFTLKYAFEKKTHDEVVLRFMNDIVITLKKESQ